MSKKYKEYSEEFKLSVIRDYYSSGMSKYACRKKYELSSPRLLLTWLRKYGSPAESVPILMNLARDLSDYFQFFGRKLHIVIFLALSKAFSAGLKAFP